MKGFEITGIDKLEKQLKKNATMQDVKNIVKMNGAELQQKAMRKAAVDTGSMKRYIMLSLLDGGLTSRINALMNYSSYVEWGTRYMSAQPFIKPAYNQQKIQFKKDLERLMK